MSASNQGSHLELCFRARSFRLSMLSRPRMRLMVTVPQPLRGQMGVNLGVGETAMPEQLLHTANVCTTVEQMGCEAMPQCVGAGFWGQPSQGQVSLEQAADTSAGE